MTLKQKLFTVFVFTKLSTRRFFRDKLALFFGILFPLIFLFVFGGINSGNNNVSFNVAVLDQAHTSFSKQFVSQLEKGDTFKVKQDVTGLADAKERMTRSQLDATIVLPEGFGNAKSGIPTGQAVVYYTQNNEQSGQTLVSVLDGVFKSINAKFVQVNAPFTVKGEALQNKSLRPFDYAFAGLVGFSIIGIGIFGPMNVFPELKKQGILRRLHATPIRVWQYFLSTMLSQALIGLLSIAILFVAAMAVFHLHVAGNYFEIAVFIVLSIFMILGIGLSIGGWARNERQAAPLGNIIVFPLMFLSGTFFPRFLMPEWLQKVSEFLPMTPVIDGLRLLIAEGKGLFEIGTQLGLIGLWMVIIYVIAFRVFRWE